MKATEKIREISEILDSSGIDDPWKEAELIVMHAMAMDHVILYRDNPELDESHETALNEIVRRRSLREPIQYIFGSCEFFGLRIMVGSGVLVPRPETELMVEKTVEFLRDRGVGVRGQGLSILDLCTGSGCIALALAREFSEAEVTGVDISGAALQFARDNAAINKIDNLSFLQGSLFEPLTSAQKYDLVISNPPYIKSEEVGTLMPEVSQWEPHNALDGGLDGLSYYRQIVETAPLYLRENGLLVMELGDECSVGVVDMLECCGYRQIDVFKDFSGTERIIKAKWTR